MKAAFVETKYCDTNNPAILSVARRLSKDEIDDAEIAKNTFYYVRDQIQYGFDIYQRKASETLNIGYGVCWNKSLLTVALLRSNGIVAHIGSVQVDRSFVKPTAGNLYRFINQPFNHCLVYAYVNGDWVILDTVLDKCTYDKCYKPLGVQWGIEWDGKSDCKLYTEHLIGNPVMHKDTDDMINRKMYNSEWPRPFALMTNSFLNKRLWKKTGAPKKGLINIAGQTI